MTTRLLNILVTTVLLIALCSPSRAQESKNSSSVIRKFTALLNVQIPPELEQYAAEGIVHLDGTAINIIQKSLNDVFTAKDSMSRPAGSDRLLYTLLVLENFRNENRISRSLLPEYMIADSNPAAQQYKISADNLFEESSVAIISAYRAEIAEIEKNKLRQASLNVGPNLTTALTTSPQYANANPPKAKPRTSTTTSRDVTNADILSTENRIWIIEERAKNTDKQLDDLDQKKQIINNITIDIHGKQKPTTPKTTTKKTKKQTKNKRISAIEQRAQKSENRLVKIERRVDDSERQIEKMIVPKQSGQQ
jgi:ubiquitin